MKYIITKGSFEALGVINMKTLVLNVIPCSLVYIFTDKPYNI